MYLAPFNYDRFFERVFKHPHIAKRFLEDILGEKIEEIIPLPRKNKITDDAGFVEFDYRCKIKGKYVIVDMQQWYKEDVIKRFFLYFCNNTSLQLEKLKPVNTPIVKKKVNKSKSYDDIEPAITLIWMADDTLGFIDDIIAFTILPEILMSFINDKTLWENLNLDELIAYREKVWSILNNDTKNLSFLTKNRLIYAFQPNIVRNHLEGKNEKLDEYVNWFLLAQKTKNKDNKAEDFETFKNKPIFMEVIELLKTSDFSNDDWEYVTDYAAYEEGLKNYNEKIKRQAIEEVTKEMSVKIKRKDDEMKRKDDEMKRKDDEMKRKDDEMKRKDDEMKRKDDEIFKIQLHQIEKLLKKGSSLTEIADFFELDMVTLQEYIKLLPKQ